MSDETELPELPERARIPDPPKAAYTRPRAGADPAARYLEKRGIGADDAGQMGKAMGLGMTLVGSIIGGVVVGALADRFLIHPKETPWGLIVGFLLGCVSGFTNLIRQGSRLN